MKPYRVLVVAADVWIDPEFLETEFRRLSTIHKRVEVIYPDDTRPWQLFIRDYCMRTEGFTGVGYRKDVFTCGSGPDVTRDKNMLLNELPDQMWKIESSKNYRRRPRTPVYPEIWAMAKAIGIECVTYRNPYAKRKRRNPGYMVPAKIIWNKRAV